MQVTIVGGGSYQWSPKLLADLLGTPSLAGVHVVLLDVDPEPLPKMEAMFRRLDEALGAGATVSSTTDQRRALAGADFVVVTISTGGFASMAVDLDVPARYGIRQSVGDSVGPGGISRSLRNIPVLQGIARDMEQLCPDAWLLNITNPMTCLTRTVTRAGTIKAVGLCHELGNYTIDVAIAFGLRWEDVRPTITGVNHFPVITALDIDGADGLVLLGELVEDVGGLASLHPQPDQAPAEAFSKLDFARRHVLSLTLLDRFGALPAAGDRHLAEFLPSVLTERSDWGADWGIELTPISRREQHQTEYIAEVDAVLAGERQLQTWPSGELVAPVIDSLLTGTRRELPLNLPNRGQCPDLPDDAVVESICVVDADGIRGRDAARAPEALAEILRRQVATQELTVEAGLTGDRRLAHAAFALDPLAGRGDLRDTEAMAEDLLAATGRWLPQFAPVGAGQLRGT
jgi:alpha-galactosidase/6-phospho-beta-glucosidase family protein